MTNRYPTILLLAASLSLVLEPAHAQKTFRVPARGTHGRATEAGPVRVPPMGG